MSTSRIRDLARTGDDLLREDRSGFRERHRIGPLPTHLAGNLEEAP